VNIHRSSWLTQRSAHFVYSRGEQFRHWQNVRHSRTHLSALPSHNTPTLPSIVASLQYDGHSQVISQKVQSSSTTYAGPAPPKSWTSDAQQDSLETVGWRSGALSLAASHINGFIDPSQPPSLALICLKILLAKCTPAEIRENIAPLIPVHLRRDLIRYSAIHFPLSDWKLDVLFHPDGHADGEILVVGPKVSLRDDYFLRGSHELQFNPRHPRPEEDWESDYPSVKPLQSLLMISTRLSASMFLTLPPTLTHMALINIQNPIPLHRFPKICPLLEFLDLSYNHWLGQPEGEGISMLDRVEWARWIYLKVLGLRDCDVPGDVLQKVNRGRWDDVAIVTG
jgi:hypothetical protein